MNIQQIINDARRVKGAVTIDDAMDRLNPGQEIFVLLNTHQNLAVIKGEIVFVQHIDIDDKSDIRVTVEFKGNDKPVVQSMMLNGMLNGKSAYVGDEVDGNLTRLFTTMEDSVKYFEQVQFCREIKTLERTSNVSSFISRLLAQRQNPKKDI